MTSRYEIAYPSIGQLDITAQVYRAGVAQETPAVTLTEGADGIYAGDTGISLVEGDDIVSVASALSFPPLPGSCSKPTSTSLPSIVAV